MEDLVKKYKLDRQAIEISSLSDEASDLIKDREYWMAQPPVARFNAVELMRQINYGVEATSGRMQKIIEITQLDKL